MKKIILSVLLLLGMSSSFPAQAQSKSEKRQSKKEQARVAHEIEYKTAIAAMENCAFVFQADQVKMGTISYNAMQTNNFVSVSGDDIVIQTEIPTPVHDKMKWGVPQIETKSGKIERIEVRRNKKGDYIYDIYYTVRNIPNKIPIYLAKGSNNANCNVGGSSSMSGKILLPSQSANYTGHYTPTIPTGLVINQ